MCFLSWKNVKRIGQLLTSDIQTITEIRIHSNIFRLQEDGRNEFYYSFYALEQL